MRLVSPSGHSEMMLALPAVTEKKESRKEHVSHSEISLFCFVKVVQTHGQCRERGREMGRSFGRRTGLYQQGNYTNSLFVFQSLARKQAKKSTHVAGLETGGSGSGITSEQSMSSSTFWPTTASFAIADLKLAIMSCWLFTMLCHSQEVR